jgi:ABC-type antimicrobial peptide transport system permease subunit
VSTCQPFSTAGHQTESWTFVTVVGLGAGLAGALVAGRWISALLFGVTPADPATLASVVCALAGAAACATYLPARRAAGVDPSEALKAD